MEENRKEIGQITPERLGQLRALNREIEQQQKLLHQLQDICQGKPMRLEGLPCLSPEQARQQYLPQLRELEGRIRQNLDQCLRELAWLEQTIAQVGDSQMRQVLSLRYISGLTWRQVAFRMGGFDEQVPRKLHKQFFQLQQEKEKPKCR